MIAAAAEMRFRITWTIDILMNMPESEPMIDRIREVLMGRYFSTKSELRHMAEAAGFNFVPVEFVSSGDQEAVASLRPSGLGEIFVHAVRPVASQPYLITEVNRA